MKKGLIIVIAALLIVIGTMAGFAAAQDETARVVNSLLECGLEGVELTRSSESEYHFWVAEDRLKGKVIFSAQDRKWDGDVVNVSISNGDELKFDIVADGATTSYTLTRHGMMWRGNGADVYLGRTCMLPLEAYRPKKIASAS